MTMDKLFLSLILHKTTNLKGKKITSGLLRIWYVVEAGGRVE